MQRIFMYFSAHRAGEIYGKYLCALAAPEITPRPRGIGRTESSCLGGFIYCCFFESLSSCKERLFCAENMPFLCVAIGVC